MPARAGKADSTLERRASASSAKSSRSVRRSRPACSKTEGPTSPPSAPRLNEFSSSSTLPTRCDCQASGSSRSSSRASPSHNRPKTSATAPGSGRSASSSSRRYRRFRATGEPRTPRSTPIPRAFTRHSRLSPRSIAEHVSTSALQPSALQHFGLRVLRSFLVAEQPGR